MPQREFRILDLTSLFRLTKSQIPPIFKPTDLVTSFRHGYAVMEDSQNLRKMSQIILGILFLTFSATAMIFTSILEKEAWSSSHWPYAILISFLLFFPTMYVISARWSLRIQVAVFSLFLLFWSLELSCRVLDLVPYPSVYRIHSKYIYEPVPSSTRITQMSPEDGGETVVESFNEYGRRDREPVPSQAEFTVAVYGDSFIEGFYSSDKDLFTTRLKENLEKSLQQSVCVYNCGVSGWGPDQICLRMEDELSQLKPDLVILSLYAGNDYNDLLRNKIFSLGQNLELVERPWELSQANRNQFEFASSSSRIFRWTAQAFSHWQMSRNAQNSRPQKVPKKNELRNFTPFRKNQLAMAKQAFESFKNNLEIDRQYLPRSVMNFELVIEPNSMGSRYQIELMKNILERIAVTAKAQSTPIIGMIIPNRVDCIFMQGPSPKEFPNYDSSLLSKLTREIAEEAGISSEDLFMPLRKASARSCFFHNDMHWNAKGQMVSAEVMTKRILEQLREVAPNPSINGLHDDAIASERQPLFK